MNIQWDTLNYAKNFDFVHKYGEDVMKLIDVPDGSRVIDLGCGNGALTQELQNMGYRVEGIDDSVDMIALARKMHPEINFICENALTFELKEKADLIFSNAVFHWIDENNQIQLAKNIAENLKEGGILVCEFGGYGNAMTVHGALAECFEQRGLTYSNTFFFPTIGQYTSILESVGLLVEYAVLFDRPTPQNTTDGAADWIRMFIKTPFVGMSVDQKKEIIAEATEKIRPELYTDAGWFIDYVRIRVKARKIKKTAV